MYEILNKINEPNDIKSIDPKDYRRLAEEIRHFLVTNVCKTGGHLASNLGVVELTMALHLFLEFPEDKLIFDVGHQSYTHKILTGRKNDFTTLRQYEGLSGFPKRSESACDAFDTGHSSTSISLADGLVKARDLDHENNKVVAVIGDGALTGGLAFEALNNTGRFKTNLIIVLNDNKMSISENVGGLSRYLGKIRTSSKYTGFKWGLEDTLKKTGNFGNVIVKNLKRSKDSIKHLFVPGMLFENMGITYIGPIDGHNIQHMITAFNAAAESKIPVLVHVVTKKGKGYSRAEKNPSRYHSVDSFDYRTGKCIKEKHDETYTEIFSSEMVRLGYENNKITAITAAMSDGTGLDAFKLEFPDRFFDVGIAEQHAVTFAGGLAAGGYHPVVAIYSTFLQRAYDQIVHDVCVGGLPVTFAIDRAGIVGNDGETHQGIFDLSYLSHIPGLTVMAPKNKNEFINMLDFAVNYNGPVAIRYPRGKAYKGLSDFNKDIEYGKSEIIEKIEIGDNYKKDIAVLAVGQMVATGEILKTKLEANGVSCTLINARFVSPIDTDMLNWISDTHKYLITIEENVKTGGFGERVAAYLFDIRSKLDFMNVSLPDSFLAHGAPEILRKELKIDADSIYDKIMKKLLTNR